MYRIAIVALVLIAATGCSGGSSDADADSTTTSPKNTTTTTTVEQLELAYIDALVVTFSAVVEGEDPVTKSLNARCLSVAWIDALSVEGLRKGDVEPVALSSGDLVDTLAELDLDDAQVTKMLDAFSGCDSDIRTLYLASLEAEAELDAATTECLTNSVDDALLRDAFATSLKQGTEGLADTEPGQRLGDAVATCMAAGG